jgi:hypothetical protein
MGGRPTLEVRCVLCGQTLDLRKDLCTDENGKALHSECYLIRITRAHDDVSQRFSLIRTS